MTCDMARALGGMAIAAILASAAAGPAEAATTTYTYDCRDNTVRSLDDPATVNTQGGAVGCIASQGVHVTPDGRANPATTYASPGVATTTVYTYDSGNGPLTQVMRAPGGPTTYTYDSVGQLSTTVQSAPSLTTTYTYNSLGSPATRTETGAQNTHTSYQYDGDGRLLSYTYDGNTASSGNAISTTTYTYDASTNLISMSSYDEDDANPGTVYVTTYTYDATGNRLTVIDTPSGGPDQGHVFTYSYDPQGRLVETLRDPDDPGPNRRTQYFYDPQNRVATMTYDSDTVDDTNLIQTTTYSYDANGRLSQIVDPGGTTTYAYTAQVSEPAGLLLLGGGLMGLLGWRRRAGSRRLQ